MKKIRITKNDWYMCIPLEYNVGMGIKGEITKKEEEIINKAFDDMKVAQAILEREYKK